MKILKLIIRRQNAVTQEIKIIDADRMIESGWILTFYRAIMLHIIIYGFVGFAVIFLLLILISLFLGNM